jgi:hypothetical protein
MKVWPNFLIVGAMKSGTTSLYYYLKQQPGIYLPEEKEPSYFSLIPGGTNSHRSISKKEYLDLFQNVKNEKIIGEASVQYLRDPDSCEKIYEQIPNTKIIILLRNPIDRAYSHYLSKLLESGISIHDEIYKDVKKLDEMNLNYDNPIVYGLYYNQVNRYLKKFGKNNVLILIYEEFFNDVNYYLKNVLEFLNASETEIKTVKNESFNEYYTPNPATMKFLKNQIIKKIGYSILPKKLRTSIYKRLRDLNKTKPKLSESDKNFLIEYYKIDIEQLEQLLGRKLPWNQ